jgi:hypothetical protein
VWLFYVNISRHLRDSGADITRERQIFSYPNVTLFFLYLLHRLYLAMLRFFNVNFQLS